MSCVYVVHCIDTEGPLHESLEATFERLRHVFHVDLPADPATLRALQEGAVDLQGREAAVQQMLDPELLAYNDTWDKIDAMLSDALSTDFRSRVPDTAGNAWVYNWFCVDHVDYDVNPRRRDIGYHNVFDHYRYALDAAGASRDGLHFHYHPHAFRKHAHLCATHWWASSSTLYQVLARRIIDRLWFPAANRPGFQVNRPDSHWFLEQFIPFDFASLSVEALNTDEQQFDFSAGRSGDWRRAPRTWRPYHPAHDDYQAPGQCRRWIGRCLNVGTRAYLLTKEEVVRAFEEARRGQPVVMAFADHDFRDVRRDVDDVRGMLAAVSKDFPDVPFLYSEAIAAMRAALDIPHQPPCELDVEVEDLDGSATRLRVRTSTPTFGPQPFLALRSHTGQYFHDNFDIQALSHEWTYVFDAETLPYRAVEKVGIAANNAYGTTSVSVLDVASGEVTKRNWNRE